MTPNRSRVILTYETVKDLSNRYFSLFQHLTNFTIFSTMKFLGHVTISSWSVTRCDACPTSSEYAVFGISMLWWRLMGLHSVAEEVRHPSQRVTYHEEIVT